MYAIKSVFCPPHIIFFSCSLYKDMKVFYDLNANVVDRVTMLEMYGKNTILILAMYGVSVILIPVVYGVIASAPILTSSQEPRAPLAQL